MPETNSITSGNEQFSASELVSAMRAAARLAPALTSPALLPLTLGNTEHGEFSLGDEDETNPFIGGALRGMEGAVQGTSVVADNLFLGFWHPMRDKFHMYKADGAGIQASDMSARIGVGALTAAWGGPEVGATKAAWATTMSASGLIEKMAAARALLPAIVGEGGSAVRAAKVAEAAGSSALVVWGTALGHLGSGLISSGVTNVILNSAIRHMITEGRQPYGWDDAANDLADGVKWAGVTNAAAGVLGAVSKGRWLKEALYHYTTEGNTFNAAKPGRSWLSAFPDLLEGSKLARDWKVLAIGGESRFKPLMEVPALKGLPRILGQMQIWPKSFEPLTVADRVAISALKGDLQPAFDHLNPFFWWKGIAGQFTHDVPNAAMKHPALANAASQAWSAMWGRFNEKMVNTALPAIYDSAVDKVERAAPYLLVGPFANSVAPIARQLSMTPDSSSPLGQLAAAALFGLSGPALHRASRTSRLSQPFTPQAAMSQLVPHLPTIDRTLDILASPLTELAVHALPAYRELTQGSAENRHEQLQGDYLANLHAFQQRQRRASSHGADDNATKIDGLNARIAQETKAYQDAGAGGDFELATLHLNKRGELVRKRNTLAQADRQPSVLPMNPGAAVLAAHHAAAQTLTHRKNRLGDRPHRSSGLFDPGMATGHSSPTKGAHALSSRLEGGVSPAPNPQLDVRLANSQTRLPSGKIQINFHADPVEIDEGMLAAAGGYGR